MTTAVPIAGGDKCLAALESQCANECTPDVRYLWSEVDRLKNQVAELQSTERRVMENQAHIRDYVASFVTHAQLEAALCTKMSQSNVVATAEKLRAEVMELLTGKADLESVQSLQSKKLDISVYESAAWDLKKLRVSLEQNLHDMFSSFAHQVEAQVNSKVSVEDFNRIFNPELNGRKEAIESAAARFSRMKDQLESLQEYVNADRLRQHKIADLNVSVLDLTRKHSASRNTVAQLISTSEAMKERLGTLESGEDEIVKHVEAISNNLQSFKSNTETERVAQHEKHSKLVGEVSDLQIMSQKMVQNLEQIQHFARDTLVKSFDTKVKQISNEFHRDVNDLAVSQRQYAQGVNAQMLKTNERLELEMERASQLENRLRKLGVQLRAVKDDLDDVKGPLVTLATNLREENVAILQEIQRSQNESRDIILDYQELLEKEQQLPSTAIPSRPSSVSVRAASAYASRKHKQQVLLLAKPVSRPRTSSSATPRTSMLSPDLNAQLSSSDSTSTRTTTGARAQTAGAAPKTQSARAPAADAYTNNLPGIDPAPLDASMKKSLYRNFGEGSSEDSDALFHFFTAPEAQDIVSNEV